MKKVKNLRKKEEESELLDLTGHVQRISEYPSAGGGFAEVFKATLQRDFITSKVGAVLPVPCIFV